MNIEALPYTIPMIMVAMTSIAIAVSTIRRRYAAGAIPLTLLFSGHALWSFGSAGNLLAISSSTKFFFNSLVQAGMLLIPVAALAFGIEYAALKRKMHWWGWLLLALEPLILVALVLFDNYTNFLGVQSALHSSGKIQVIQASYQILHPFHLSFAYLALLVTGVLLLRGLMRSSHFFAGQGIVMSFGLLIPWLANILEMNHLNLFAPLELTPLAFMATQAAFLFGVFQFRLLDILPLARSSVIEQLSDGVIVLDSLNRITDLNPAAERITGCPSRRWIGWRVDEVPTIQCNELLAMIATGADQHTEITLEQGDEVRHYDLHVKPIYQRSQLIGNLVLLHDISDQKVLQSALLASEEKYRRLVERSNDGIAIIQDGKFYYTNPQLAAMLGYSVEEMAALPVFNQVIVEDRAGVRDNYNRRLAGEAIPSRYETFLLRKDGERLAIEINSGLMEYEGHPAVLVFIRDISEQKHASQELERLLALLQATIELTADGILVIGQDHLVLSNHRFDEMWRLPSNWSTLPGHDDPFQLLSVHIQDENAFLERVRELNVNPESEGYALIPLKDNRIFERYAMPYRITGRIAGKVWNFRDVTRQKQAEEALQQANERLTQTVRELEHHNREVSLLSDMGDMLHSCSNLEEAYAVVADFSYRLFPEQSGALYIFRHSHNLAEAAASWGPDQLQPDFPPDACWALRRGRLHIVNDRQIGLRCRHATGPSLDEKLPTMCVPLIAQSETIGVFHLSGHPKQSYNAWEKLVTAVAETTAMSLANLRLRETLQMQSIRDPLTGLYNRRYMEQALELEIRRALRYHRNIGMIMIDVDHFKELNDKHGHKAGDQLLETFGRYLLDNLREEDFACRYGGEEFLVVLTEAGLESCRARAEELRQGIRGLNMFFEGEAIDFTISVGVASYPENGRTAEATIMAADAALYSAKRSGRNRVVISTQMIPSE